MDSRTSWSRKANDRRAKSGRLPTSYSIWSSTALSEKSSIPQPVWWISTISSVPSSRWLMTSERIASSVTTPPALRMTWASPGSRPRARAGSRRASMQASTATLRAGRPGAPAASKPAANRALWARRSSVLLIARCRSGVRGRRTRTRHLERQLVHVAPPPVLARLERADQRVVRLVEVGGGVAVGRAVAAADVATGLAHPQVDPATAHAQAVLASLGGRRHGLDFGQVGAGVGHGMPLTPGPRR